MSDDFNYRKKKKKRKKYIYLMTKRLEDSHGTNTTTKIHGPEDKKHRHTQCYSIHGICKYVLNDISIFFSLPLYGLSLNIVREITVC